MNQGCKRDDLWSIILAGGEGERLRPLMQRWLGQHKPKQYCTFVGTRSMLQHTLDRADQISDPEQKVTVIAGHTVVTLGRNSRSGKLAKSFCSPPTVTQPAESSWP
jgi:mannose-1-phosphate guanylyltransferase